MTISLQRLLVISGIIVIPFYELIFKVFPYVRVIAPDTRIPKELVAIGFALAIGLLAVFQGKIKPFGNKYLIAIPLYLLFNLWMSPQVDLLINNVNCGDLYFWKPFSQVLCFALMIIAISSSDDDFTPVLRVMMWCGVVMSVYVIMQKLGFDQFWVEKAPEQWVARMADAQVGGNLGQKTVVASFLAMLIPLTVYFKKYYMAGIIVVGVLCTGSDMALLAIALMMFFYIVKFMGKNFYKISLASFMIIFITFGFCYSKFEKTRIFVSQHSSGRISVWKDIIKDIRDGAIEGSSQDLSTTGVGFGRFAFIFPDRHKSIFAQAHNDFLEFTYNCGFVGLFLLVVGIWFMISRTNLYGINFSILLSFGSILFMSLGSFPFQLGAHQFYSAVLIGLLHNNSIIKGEIKC